MQLPESTTLSERCERRAGSLLSGAAGFYYLLLPDVTYFINFYHILTRTILHATFNVLRFCTLLISIEYTKFKFKFKIDRFFGFKIVKGPVGLPV